MLTRTFLILMLFGFVMLFSSAAWCGAVVPDGWEPTNIPCLVVIDPVTQQTTSECFYNIGSPSSPIPVSYDGNAGPWIKQINNNTAKWTFTEYLQVSGMSWTDWHEIVDNGPSAPGWIWQNADMAIIQPDLSELPVQGLNIFYTSDCLVGSCGSVANFLFDTLTDGTRVRISKELTWAAGGTAPSLVTVKEFPTVPLPAALPLLLSGLVGIGLIGRRRKTV